jgi:hypothetical protein
MENNMEFLLKTRIGLLYDPTILPLVIHTRELKSVCQKDICMLGHECTRGPVWERIRRRGGGKKRILRGEEDGSMLYIYI